MKQSEVKICGLSVSINMNILIPMIFFFVMGKLNYFMVAMFFSLLHEISHLAAARLAGCRAVKIQINMFGEILYLDDSAVLPWKEALIHFAGPAFNLMAGFSLLIIWGGRGMPVVDDIILINSILGLFNLMPFYPLDGGKILCVYLKYFMDEMTAKRIALGFSKIFLIFNFILGIYLVQYNLLNIMISFLSANIFLSLRDEETGFWYDKVMKAKKEQDSGNNV